MLTTLKNKFLLWSGILLTLVAVLGSVSIVSVAGMWRAAGATSAEYDALDRAEAASVQVAWLRDSLNAGDPVTYRNLQFFVPIQTEVKEVARELREAAAVDDGDAAAQRNLAKSAE